MLEHIDGNVAGSGGAATYIGLNGIVEVKGELEVPEIRQSIALAMFT